MHAIARFLPAHSAGLSVKSKVRKFWQASRPLKGLLLRLPWMIGGMRLGLRLFPFQRMLRSVERWSRESVSATLTPEEIKWAVKTVGRRLLPDRPCLTLALVTTLLLQRRGYPATLRIGVAKDRAGELAAHAWVESEGRIFLGELPDLDRYTPLPSLDLVKENRHE